MRLFLCSADRAVILESPASSVLEGSTVTLLCRGDSNSSDQTFTYYKDGRTIRSNITGRLALQPVSLSDQGLYSCSVDGGRRSAGSWLSVQRAAQG